MESHLSEESRWASGLAARLRLILANFADDPPATRQTYISEEIERALKEVVPSKRAAFLAALGERFPAWQSSVASPSGPGVPSGEAVEETPGAVLARLIELIPSLPAQTQEEFARKLQQVLPRPPGADFSVEVPPEFQKKLGLPSGKALHAERTIKLVSALFEMTLAMDQLVWALWKQLAPQSNIRKEGDLGKLVGPYLTGDTEVSTQQLVQLLEKTRKLNASLLGATGRGSSNYAQKFVGQFAPDVIENLAKLEKSFAQSLESVSWKKYVQLSKEYASQPVIENEIQKAIAKAAEKLMMGGANI